MKSMTKPPIKRPVRSRTPDNHPANRQATEPKTQFGRTTFYVSLSQGTPELVSFDGTMCIPVASLDSAGLMRAKNQAHNQYVQAMINDLDDLDVHRATLNFLCKAVERVGYPTDRPHAPRNRSLPSRPKAKSSGRGREHSQAA